ncbi:SH3 domain-containing protein [Haliscomenobacter sp.]|uniref:SH3 domain-containing protein n=1 Tax=Haliscomenobacter sp. TaxID=2717303 RepID=UPI003594194A
MKKLLLFTLLATLAFSCRNKKNQEPENTVPEAPKSTAPYQVGQTMYVHALLGLSLRKAPDPKSEKIGAAQYGELLEILALPEADQTYVAETIDEFQLKGHWVKVKNADQKEAYVFDGYLAKFPVIAEEPEEDTALPEWFYMTLAKPKGEREVTAPNEKKGIVEGYKQAFADGGEFELILYNGGVTQFLRIPSSTLTFSQALVVLRSFYFNTAKNLKIVRNAKTKKIRVNDTANPYEWLEFEDKGDKVIVGFYSAD